MLREIILPSTTTIKNMMYGPIPVGQVKAGDRVIGYNYHRRSLTHITIISKQELLARACVDIFLNKLGIKAFCEVTELLTPLGIDYVSDRPRSFTGTCALNPKTITVKQVHAYTNTCLKDSVSLTWEGDDNSYLWVEGLLGGNGRTVSSDIQLESGNGAKFFSIPTGQIKSPWPTAYI